MFTALILMCALHTEGKDIGSCFTVSPNAMFSNQEVCEQSIKKVLGSGTLALKFEDYEPKDWYCVNWTALKA